MASPWATLTKRCFTGLRPNCSTAGAANATTVPYRIRPNKSRWTRLKTEELEARDWFIFADLADARTSVVEYFDYYNHDRRHSSIDYLKPYQIHQQLLNNITRFSPA